MPTQRTTAAAAAAPGANRATVRARAQQAARTSKPSRSTSTSNSAKRAATHAAHAAYVEPAAHDHDQDHDLPSNIYVLPYGMEPAPEIAEEDRASVPIDLGEWNLRLKGWKVVFDLTADVSVYEDMETGQQAGSKSEQRAALVRIFKSILLAWNFRNLRTNDLLPQPRAGGAELTPNNCLVPIMQAWGRVNSIPKAELEKLSEGS